MARKKRGWNVWTVVLGVIAVIIVGIAIGPSALRVVNPIPPLAGNLPADPAERDHLFKERVQKRFPIGSPAKALVKELRAQGFAVHADTEVSNDWAEYVAHDWICESQWSIFWQEGPTGELLYVNASFGVSC